MTSKRKIEVWESQNMLEKKSALPSLGQARFQATQVEMKVLLSNLSQVLSEFQEVLDNQPKSPSDYYVDEIELSLGVNGNGSIALIGKLEAGLQAGIKVKLKRKLEE